MTTDYKIDTPVPVGTGDLFGLARRYWAAPFRYDAEGQFIWDANGERVVDLRGWGHLTGKGSHALAETTALKIVDDLGEGVAKVLNTSWPNKPVEPRP